MEIRTIKCSDLFIVIVNVGFVYAGASSWCILNYLFLYRYLFFFSHGKVLNAAFNEYQVIC
ncbi:hypothetical protein ACQKJG_25630 [Priestia megaterium]|uniref:hypothetical protein n=1 Tax=Priestia megaterium TaxID=1404 RepID=UPI001C2F2C7E